MQLQKTLKGLNLGSWLLMEAYILGSRNISESEFKAKFKKIYGLKGLQDFEHSFRNNFITKADFKRISLMGANVVRIPFNYRLFEKKASLYDQNGFSYLDKAFSWAAQYNLGIILDLHAAPGAQNCDWHADSKGKALLWEKARNMSRTFYLWEKIVARYKNKPSLIGYDLLNEPVLGSRSPQILKKFYAQLIKCIRSLDRKKVIFLEGDLWAQRIDFLESLIDDKVVISIHNYQPLDYVFHFRPFYKFPGKIEGIFWNKDKVYQHLKPYYKFSQKNKVKILVGEFGINWRGGFWGELKWLEANLSAYQDYGFDYTYWTYKAMANQIFPDGLYQQVENSKYINRQGRLTGWETYFQFWKTEKRNISSFWRTENFQPNKDIINLLKKYFQK